MSDGGIALDPPRERDERWGIALDPPREREMSDGLGMGRKRGLRGAAAARRCCEGLLDPSERERDERWGGDVEMKTLGGERNERIFPTFHLQSFWRALKC
ncbi:hypothetical protein MRB53_016201 [Persea americana]|uniref:Uncharacterized protein n=1 Tax=Persea americana TaxID=3435 RepID=A0ACC2M188_PERAE|nr:hypothetical protein MRB53_016201 [Persea americana]